MLAPSFVCSWLQESELETWKTFSLPSAKSVLFIYCFLLPKKISTRITELSFVGLLMELWIIFFVGKRCANNLWQKLPEIKGHRIHRVCGDVLCTSGNRPDWSEAAWSSHHRPGISGRFHDTVWIYSCFVVLTNVLNITCHTRQLFELIDFFFLNTHLFCSHVNSWIQNWTCINIQCKVLNCHICQHSLMSCLHLQAEKNRAAAAANNLQKGSAGPMRLYVGSLHFNITEEMLRGIFEPFGKVWHAVLKSKPFTYVGLVVMLLFFFVIIDWRYPVDDGQWNGKIQRLWLHIGN